MKDDELAKYGAQYDGVWSWAVAKGRKDTSRTGKWMLWPEGEKARAVWRVKGLANTLL